ncbi:MAG: mandelate racemase/muconate lactonizing enzyme family protein, partial [Cyanobacteria bacterium J06598_3]
FTFKMSIEAIVIGDEATIEKSTPFLRTASVLAVSRGCNPISCPANIPEAINIPEAMTHPIFPSSPCVPEQAVDFSMVASSPITIASIDILKVKRRRIGLPGVLPRNRKEAFFIRTRSTDGAVGFSVAHSRIKQFYPILKQLVIPYFIGKDVRDLATLIDEVYVFDSNYKLSGLALWCCVAWLEISLLDLLGKQVNQSVGQLLEGRSDGPQNKSPQNDGERNNGQDIPIYLSSLRRDTTPEEEVAWVGDRIDELGAKAIKFKIGGRMSQDQDAMPRRTEKLVARARKELGDAIAIGVDGNGSFSTHKAIEIGHMLESYGVSFFEEPCPFDEFESTEQVTKALKLSVTGGEQETSFARFKQMIHHRVVGVLQPDVVYNGGFIRTLRVAQVAATAQMPMTIHNARLGVDPIYMAQFARFLPGNYQEFNAQPEQALPWCTPTLKVQNGKLRVPSGPGLGLTIEPRYLRQARKL